MKKYLIILNLLLIPAITYFGVKAFYRTMTAQLDHIPMPQAVSQSVVSSQDETRHPLSYYNPVIERNLFNTKDREVEQPKEEPKKEESRELEETTLKLALWGTVSGNENRAYAVIEDKKERKQNLYREGDMILNAIVKKILREQVILSVNDKDEILKMAKKKPRERGRRSSRERSRSKPRAEKRSSQNIKIARSKVEEAISDVGSLMKTAKIKPHFKDGKPDGLTLTRVKRKSIFRKLGLRSGDIIMGVDGTPIESVDDALKFYNSLKSSSNVALEIKRRGRMKNIEYEVQD
ncbi:type II secretion system protein GspC [Desulfobacterales bacterium HSG2]|nr:type II secretion system protein GspC [Desulfobacterales bacterium HSG2]